MKKISSVLLFILLLVISFAVYLLQYLLFRDLVSTSFYFLQDMAFLPLQVAIVTIVLGKYINAMEKRERLKKVNMAVSAFFSESGSDILKNIIKSVGMTEQLKSKLDITSKWESSDFKRAAGEINGYDFNMGCRGGHLPELKALLINNRGFMLSMLSNPNLLEHDTFTDMLWALNHLTDELNARDSLESLPDTDLDHLTNDIKRALNTLLVQWVHYMEHLKSDYPYLFSLEVRKNPFGSSNSVIVR